MMMVTAHETERVHDDSDAEGEDHDATDAVASRWDLESIDDAR